MGQFSKLWFRFKEVLAKENSMVQLDLNELTQYLEQSVMLVGQAFNAIAYNQRLNALSAVRDNPKAKSIIKDQAELLEKPSADLFGRVVRDYLKETAKVKKDSLVRKYYKMATFFNRNIPQLKKTIKEEI